MFAVLLSEEMDPFYQNISSFPTVIFTFFLGLCVLYWIVAVLGWVHIDALDFDFSHDVDTEVGTPDVLGGLFMKLGLTGVPITIILTFVSLIGWLLSYFIVHFSISFFEPGIIRYMVGVPVFLFSLYIACVITGFLIRPLRPFFEKVDQEPIDKKVLGQVAVVRTTVVNQEFGEAFLEDGGAGLILKVRATGDETFEHGDRVVLLEYIEEGRLFRVISEQEFNGP